MERDDHDRTSLKHLLENSFEVVDFGNDFDAVEYIKRNTIDLAVLSDNLLENINGARLLLALRENSRQTFRAFALVSRLSGAQQNYLNTAGFEKIIGLALCFY